MKIKGTDDQHCLVYEMTFSDCAIKVLKKAEGPLKVGEITRRAIQAGLQTRGKTPSATMRGIIEKSISRKGNASPFVRVGTAYGLRKEST